MKRKRGASDNSASGKRVKVTNATESTCAVKVTHDGSKIVNDRSSASDNASASVGAQRAKSRKVQINHEKERAETAETIVADENPALANVKPSRRINKLVPPRPFPTVPTSVSATGPRSAHNEGKNFICITRKTPLGSYMRRCKDVILKDGYKTLHLSAMGAAIPHLVQLSVALPPILPFASDEIHTEILTGTVEVQDEIIPDDEDEDISYGTRGKSTLMIVIKIGDGEREGNSKQSVSNSGKKKGGNEGARSGNGKGKERMRDKQVVFQEPEQSDVDMI